MPLLEGRATKVKDIGISSPGIYYTVFPTWEPECHPPSPDSRSSITDGKWLVMYGPNPESAMGVPMIRALVETQRKVDPELYNLEEDPQCLKALIGEKQSVVRELRSAYLEFLLIHKVLPNHVQHFKLT